MNVAAGHMDVTGTHIHRPLVGKIPRPVTQVGDRPRDLLRDLGG